MDITCEDIDSFFVDTKAWKASAAEHLTAPSGGRSRQRVRNMNTLSRELASATNTWRRVYGAPLRTETDGIASNDRDMRNKESQPRVRFAAGTLLPLPALPANEQSEIHLLVRRALFQLLSGAVVPDSPAVEESHYVRRIMDSGASMNMTSAVESLDPTTVRLGVGKQGIRIQGFNGMQESTRTVGSNKEGFDTALLQPQQMPVDLELLCAHDYASLGAVVLHAHGGSVLRLDDQERQRFLEYIAHLREVMRLKVHRKIYEVDPNHSLYSLTPASFDHQDSSDQAPVDDAYFVRHATIVDSQDPAVVESIIDTAYSSIYTLGRVNYSDTDSRIYGMLLSGVTFATLKHTANNQSILGIHPSITATALRTFEKQHGSTPDIVALANYDAVPHYKSFEKEIVQLKRPGQHLLNDTFFSDFNTTAPVAGLSASNKEPTLSDMAKRVSKLTTYGGAIAMNLTVCAYTGFVHGFLLQPQVTALSVVTQALDSFATGLQCTTEMFSADDGIVSDSKFTVYTPPVRALLLSRHIKFQKALPYNHSNGLSQGELTGRYIKRILRLAYNIGIASPGIKRLGYTQLDIKKCWGETCYLAVTLLLTRPAWNDASKTRFEAALGRKFNILTIPLLPIYSILLAWHPAEKAYVYCLYMGPAWRGLQEEPTPGAIRAMYKRGTGNPSIFLTAGYKCVTSGSSMYTEQAMQRSTERLLLDAVAAREATVPTAAAANPVGGECVHVSDEQALEPATPASTQTYDPEMHDGVPELWHSDDEEEAPLSVQHPSNQSGGTMGRLVSRRQRRQRQEAEQWLELDDTTLQDNSELSKPQSKQQSSKQRLHQGIVLDKAAQHDQYSRPYKANNRSERYSRRDGKNSVSLFAYEAYTDEHDPTGEHACYVESLFADWTNSSESVYYSYELDTFIRVPDEFQVTDAVVKEAELCSEYGYKAVTVDVPRTWTEALRHPLWGDAARTEKDTLLEKSMVLIPEAIAREAVLSGAEIVNLFPVFEEKVKEGKTVYKVRLVGDGRQQQKAGDTYAETPSRDEFRIFMHLVAHYDWDFYHCDEKRAFLNAKYLGETPVFARLGKEFYKVIGALYGLKASPRHYQAEVIARLTRMSFQRLGLCSCIYIKYMNTNFVMVFDYVDDFVWTGTTSAVTESVIDEFRMHTSTTPVVKNPTAVLGIDIVRNREDHTVQLSMSTKIDDLYGKISSTFIDKYKVSVREPYVPLSSNNVHIEDEVYVSGSLKDTEYSRLLDPSEVLLYLSLVGGLLWQIGIRWDILYSVLYLTWFTHCPRVHHMNMAARVILYLYHTRDIKLILGGKDQLEIITTTDATLNTAPKGRSVIAYATRLGVRAGLVSAKCRASIAVLLSTFESELHGVAMGISKGEGTQIFLTDVTEAVKQAAGVSNMLTEMGSTMVSTSVYSDNKSMVDYVNGKGQAKGVKHALLRLWYLREQVQKGIHLQWVEGKTILANPMTKAVHRTELEMHREDVQGYRIGRALASSKVL